ncbi:MULTISPECIES: hypothetical protein [Phyllobacteriaceae]|jgi:hypothetical protein|uniref:DUF1127 domain-containing protein n=1 Tax=Mesorhizobium hungaricum TaxID=1566387 RepID=A0A1C2DEU2_9HYPH|nr:MULTISPECIES: hypothetical protein [Mesorhizobium]MBN9232625.1 hypothetical protein [Mesorhizobium sp.]MDQ0330222.1 hypothetical protein [Mesorhizobium sp. YL-MeA3-2017]OCX13258.1 hypothetical protein QV13_27480 [Mesorhizobium hungaricum]
MSAIVLKSEVARPNRIRPLLDWLRHARIAINLPPQDSGYLSDAHLRDIGLRRTDIARSVSDAPQRLGLLDLGWQPPRSNKHR